MRLGLSTAAAQQFYPARLVRRERRHLTDDARNLKPDLLLHRGLPFAEAEYAVHRDCTGNLYSDMLRLPVRREWDLPVYRAPILRLLGDDWQVGGTFHDCSTVTLSTLGNFSQ